MSRRPTDRELDRLLAKLPREAAPAGFSRRVLRGLESRRAATARSTGPAAGWWMAATAVAAALAAALWLLPRPAAEPSPAEARALREEHRLLMQELQALKTSLHDTQAAPIIYLGGNETLDLVLDLAPVWEDATTLGQRPAVLGGADRPVPASDRGGPKR